MSIKVPIARSSLRKRIKISSMGLKYTTLSKAVVAMICLVVSAVLVVFAECAHHPSPYRSIIGSDRPIHRHNEENRLKTVVASFETNTMNGIRGLRKVMGASADRDRDKTLRVDFMDGSIGTNTNEGSGGEMEYIDFGGDEETYEVEVDADSSLAKAAVALEEEKYTVKGFINRSSQKKGGYKGPVLSKREKFLPTVSSGSGKGHRQKRGTRFIKMTAGALRSASNRVSLVSKKLDQMTYLQIMAAGAVSRTMAQTIMHPANTFKTMLQLKRTSDIPISEQLTPERLLRGADAQFLLSLPHGAFYFVVIDQVKSRVTKLMPKAYDNLSDFAASAISTVVCSIVSTPQMVLTDRLMAGVYPNFPVALKEIFKQEGLRGFYTGWRSGLAQKIPSYGLTWMFFQQLKRVHQTLFDSKPNAETNFVLGALAAAGGVTVMIPMDTVKTRLVIQGGQGVVEGAAYKGVRDCFYRIFKEEGALAFYRALPPRLGSVVPMIAIQFGTYEIIKSKLVQYNSQTRIETAISQKQAARAARARKADQRDRALASTGGGTV